MKLLLTVVTLVILGTGFPIRAKAADNDDNASKCKNLALKAHPSSLPDIPAVTNLRHDYYTLCMARHGKMGVVNPGTATAAPGGHFDGGYVGPGNWRARRSFSKARRRRLLGAWSGSVC